MTTSINRRELLKSLGVGGLAAAAGCYSDDPGDAVLGPVGGGDAATVAVDDGLLIYAADYAAAVDAWQAATAEVAIAWTGVGNRYAFGTGGVSVAGLEIKVGADSYDEAKTMVDTYPTIVWTDSGNQYLFTES